MIAQAVYIITEHGAFTKEAPSSHHWTYIVLFTLALVALSAALVFESTRK